MIFELGIFSFNSYVYYLTRGFIASTRAFNLLNHDFSLATSAFSIAAHALSLLTREFELVDRGSQLATRRFEIVTRISELVTRNLCLLFHNLNSISAHNYPKVSLLNVYLTVHKFDIVCLSETYLDSNTAPDNVNLEISGYSLVRSGPYNSKREGVCIYYKYYLHLRVLGIQYFHECFNIELKIGNKLCYIIALYRSLSQSQCEFEKFSEKLELNLDSLVQNNPFLLVLIGDFNMKSKNWYKNDKCSFEGNIIKNVTLQFYLQQMQHIF